MKNPYLNVVENLKQSLANTNQGKIRLDIISIDDFQHESESLNNNNISLILTIGLNAAKAVFDTLNHDAKNDMPVFCVLIPEYAFKQLLESTERFAAGAIFIDQPLHRQVDFAVLLKPDLKRIGIPVGSVSRENVKKYMSVKKNVFPEIELLNVESAGIDHNALNRLVDNTDVILAVADPTVHKGYNAKRILYNSYSAMKPVIAFSRSYVTAGALASIYSTPAQIGRQAAEFLVEYFATSGKLKTVYRFPKYFSISVNESVARTLGIEQTDEQDILRKLQQKEKMFSVYSDETDR